MDLKIENLARLLSLCVSLGSGSFLHIWNLYGMSISIPSLNYAQLVIGRNTACC